MIARVRAFLRSRQRRAEAEAACIRECEAAHPGKLFWGVLSVEEPSRVVVTVLLGVHDAEGQRGPPRGEAHTYAVHPAEGDGYRSSAAPAIRLLDAEEAARYRSRVR